MVMLPSLIYATVICNHVIHLRGIAGTDFSSNKSLLLALHTPSQSAGLLTCPPLHIPFQSADLPTSLPQYIHSYNMWICDLPTTTYMYAIWKCWPADLSITVYAIKNCWPVYPTCLSKVPACRPTHHYICHFKAPTSLQQHAIKKCRHAYLSATHAFPKCRTADLPTFKYAISKCRPANLSTTVYLFKKCRPVCHTWLPLVPICWPAHYQYHK